MDGIMRCWDVGKIRNSRKNYTKEKSESLNLNALKHVYVSLCMRFS